MKNSILLILLSIILFSCKPKEEINPKDLLIGQWDIDEWKEASSGEFAKDFCRCLTYAYDDGLVFFSDNTFAPRMQMSEDNTLTSGERVGNFQWKDAQTLLLIFHPNTPDETVLTLQVLKLTEKELWFKRSLFFEGEFHLKKVE